MPEDDEEGAPGLPPHPLDRVWFHPSELGAPPVEPAPVHRSRMPQWAIVTVAALCGAIATVAVLTATGDVGGGGGSVGSSSSIVPVFAQLERDHTADLVATAGASVVAVRALRPDGSDVAGSGVALGRDRIVTSATVVAGASEVEVTTDHGRVFDATVLGSDPETDLALLDVKDVRVPPAETRSADDLSVGTWVLAVAASGGENRWASQGVVSGLRVLVDRGDGSTMPGLVATDVDAPASAGGGVLLDDEGSVVGILTRAAPGHAVPFAGAREVVEQLAASGRVHHAWLGVDAADAAGREGGGAVVEGVAAGGPGQAATLLPGDVITSLDDARVADLADLVAAVAKRRPGDPVELTVHRGDERLRLRTSLAERP